MSFLRTALLRYKWYTKTCTYLNVDNLMSWETRKAPEAIYHSQGNGHIQHLPEFCPHDFVYVCLVSVFVVRTLNLRSILLNFEGYSTILLSRFLDFVHLA